MTKIDVDWVVAMVGLLADYSKSETVSDEGKALAEEYIEKIERVCEKAATRLMPLTAPVPGDKEQR